MFYIPMTQIPLNTKVGQVYVRLVTTGWLHIAAAKTHYSSVINTLPESSELHVTANGIAGGLSRRCFTRLRPTSKV